MDEATARIMAERGVWLSIQPFLNGLISITVIGYRHESA